MQDLFISFLFTCLFIYHKSAWFQHFWKNWLLLLRCDITHSLAAHWSRLTRRPLGSSRPPDWTMVVVRGREQPGEGGWPRHSSGSSCRQTDRSANQLSAWRPLSVCDWFLLERLRPLLHFPSFGVDDGTVDVGVDQIRLIKRIKYKRIAWNLKQHLFPQPLRGPITACLPWWHHTGTGGGPVCSDPILCTPEPEWSRSCRRSSRPGSAGWFRWGSSPTRSERGTITAALRSGALRKLTNTQLIIIIIIIIDVTQYIRIITIIYYLCTRSVSSSPWSPGRWGSRSSPPPAAASPESRPSL